MFCWQHWMRQRQWAWRCGRYGAAKVDVGQYNSNLCINNATVNGTVVGISADASWQPRSSTYSNQFPDLNSPMFKWCLADPQEEPPQDQPFCEPQPPIPLA